MSGYRWFSLAVPSHVDSNPHVYPTLLQSHLRDGPIPCKMGNQGHACASSNLPCRLLDFTRIHLPPTLQDLAPARTAAIFQGLVLLLPRSGAVQHQHGSRHFLAGPSNLSNLAAANARQEARKRKPRSDTRNIVSFTPPSTHIVQLLNSE